MCDDAHLLGSDQRCPRCGGREIYVDSEMRAGGHGPGIAACPTCSITWEIFKAEDLLDDTPLSSFKSPCNNCAFRKGSQERTDPYMWMQISESLEDGVPFYCHKGVPITPNTNHGFAYPTKTVVVEHSVNPVSIEVPDSARLRLCRGWLNSRWAQIKRDLQTAGETT